MHVSETTEDAVEGFREGAIREFYEFQVAVNGRPEPEGGPDEWYDAYVANQLIGSPDDVRGKIAEIATRAGGFGGFIFMNREWAGVEANRESWRLFAGEVAPHFV
jgi:alkanesulfonate monooxygenase SsuD/methylene tetrahydromethanopterin reductase-like flavin-dependent oxidoreductase (luciferase family)